MTTIPRGTSTTREPAGGPEGPRAVSWSRQGGALRGGGLPAGAPARAPYPPSGPPPPRAVSWSRQAESFGGLRLPTAPPAGASYSESASVQLVAGVICSLFDAEMGRPFAPSGRLSGPNR